MMNKQILILFVLALLIGCHGVELYTLRDSSMYPTIEILSNIMVDPDHYLSNPINRFDIVCVQDPAGRNINYITRVIGLGGEKIAILDGQIYLNGKILIENFETIPPPWDFAIIKIPDDEYFLLGDNRAGSHDSRDWGTVNKSFIEGKVIYSW